MHITFTKNIHFTKLLKTAERVREFNFRRIPNTSGGLIHVDVPDDRGNRLVFKMQKEEGQQWRIVEQHLPIWVMDNEKKLNDLIEEEL
jgi:hypothetical protein